MSDHVMDRARESDAPEASPGTVLHFRGAMSAPEYHADPAPAPSLSSSLARVMVLQSPLHAAVRHPRLSKIADQLVPSGDRLDIGSAAHALWLEGAASVVVVDAGDWRSKSAREQRDAARAEGRLVMLRAQFEAAREMVEVLDDQIRPQFMDLAVRHLVDPSREKFTEHVIVWKQECWNRARLDILFEDRGRGIVVDYKTTGRSARDWRRTLWSQRYDVQLAHYAAGCRAAGIAVAAVGVVVQETQPPYAAVLYEVAASELKPAARALAACREAWRRGVEDGAWQSYPSRPVAVAAPSWIVEDELPQLEAEEETEW